MSSSIFEYAVKDWEAQAEVYLRGVRPEYAVDGKEVIGYQTDNVNPALYSVYVRGTDGLSQCVGDHDEYQDAVEQVYTILANHGGLVVGYDSLVQEK